MKKQIKLMILAIFSFFALTSNAQINFKKSDKFVEGTASLRKKTGSNSNWILNPKVGYFVTNMFAIGAFGSVADTFGVRSSAVGAFGRCYFLNGKTTKIYSELNASYTTDGTKGFKSGLGIGLNQFITKKVALTLNLADLASYSRQSGKSDFYVGFEGVNNPFAINTFGLLYKF